MIFYHNGTRPIYKIKSLATWPGENLNFKYYEKYPEDHKFILGEFWTNRQLNSGCSEEIFYEPSESIFKNNTELIYCHHCDEWFAKKEFSEDKKNFKKEYSLNHTTIF